MTCNLLLEVRVYMDRLAYKLSYVDFGNICSSCPANCCKRFYAVLLPDEEEEFEEHSFTINTERGSVKCIGAREGNPCPFLDPQGRCTIYEKRPFDCRVWPIMMYIDLETRERVIYLDLDCPAVREGRIPLNLVKRIVETLKTAEISDEWLERYTLAPWPNNLVEIERFKPSKTREGYVQESLPVSTSARRGGST
jgi:Fe-S-cluster containining protein